MCTHATVCIWRSQDSRPPLPPWDTLYWRLPLCTQSWLVLRIARIVLPLSPPSLMEELHCDYRHTLLCPGPTCKNPTNSSGVEAAGFKHLNSLACLTALKSSTSLQKCMQQQIAVDEGLGQDVRAY